MPNMANITIKKADGTTNVTYNAISPSSGDRTAAVWKNQSVVGAIGFQPEMRLIGKESKIDGVPARELRATFFYPQLITNTTTGVTSIHRRAMGNGTFVMPKDMTAADVAEYAAQFANLLASALVQQCLQSGYSAS